MLTIQPHAWPPCRPTLRLSPPPRSLEERRGLLPLPRASAAQAVPLPHSLALPTLPSCHQIPVPKLCSEGNLAPKTFKGSLLSRSQGSNSTTRSSDVCSLSPYWASGSSPLSESIIHSSCHGSLPASKGLSGFPTSAFLLILFIMSSTPS